MPADLIVLAADRDIEQGVQGLLGRPAALGIRPLRGVSTLVHPERDPGCARRAHHFLRPFLHDYLHALVVFDRQGSGLESLSAAEIADEVRRLLAANGWGARAEVIVLDPELEVWVFATSAHVERCLGWPSRRLPPLRHWLADQGLWARADAKPADPRVALERVLREASRPRSSSIYRCLAERALLSLGNPSRRGPTRSARRFGVESSWSRWTSWRWMPTGVRLATCVAKSSRSSTTAGDVPGAERVAAVLPVVPLATRVVPRKEVLVGAVRLRPGAPPPCH